MKIMTEKRYCKQCGKELVRKKYKRKSIKRGWEWELPKHFLARNFCNGSCRSISVGKHRNDLRHWTKELILKEFNKIITERKWNSVYMAKNHLALYAAIRKYYKKNPWCKFLIEQGRQPIQNHINPQKKINAKLLLKYWKEEEIYNGVGKIFKYGMAEGIPGINQNFGDVGKAIKHLIKLRAIRIFKKGYSGGGRTGNLPTQYVLLKSRV